MKAIKIVKLCKAVLPVGYNWKSRDETYLLFWLIIHDNLHDFYY